MVEIGSPDGSAPELAESEYLLADEWVAVVDDSPEIVLLLSHYLAKYGFNVARCGSAGELMALLRERKVALVILDIGLPDRDGNEILSEIVPSNPELAIIMVTGTTDIQIALDCLRQGADDYLTKPVSMGQFNHTIISTLKKRRLVINNRLYQQELLKTNAQMRFLHQLNQKMNTAYLNTVELHGVLRAILLGITSNEGLRFNRAFLALFDHDNAFLVGRLGVGPSSKEEAGRIWSSLEAQGMNLANILKTSLLDEAGTDRETNQAIQSLNVPSADHDHILIRATRESKAILVEKGIAAGCTVPPELTSRLGLDSFAVVPLLSPNRSLGVIIVDNFVTGKPILEDDMHGLEIFASQASLAIEQSHLYAAMEQKIAELEQLTRELEESKDLLIEAERTAALGSMSAQLLHSVRNPITSIGGTSRLLTRKVDDDYVRSFLKVITEEANKIENVLDDIGSIKEETSLNLGRHQLFPLIRRSMMSFYSVLKKNRIGYTFKLEGDTPVLMIDERKIRRVFTHLIRNSIDAMGTDGTLSIEVAQYPDNVEVIFTDTGSASADETSPAGRTSYFNNKTFGNSMGLALIENILESHRGFFYIEAMPGGGTRATVRLPANPDFS
jgi:signal transduction histidine kinase/DNA-binding response OmpR family regulator